MYREISACRICGNSKLLPVLSLGEMAMTGIFPTGADSPVPRGPLHLVRCDASASPDGCGLVQLLQTYRLEEMYGDRYGYRSGLNASMVRHLTGIAERMKRHVSLRQQDVVLDIGSNDGTLLASYPPGGPLLVGIDPVAAKFRKYYRPDIEAIPQFFSADAFRARFGAKKAKIVTSIAVLYDLEHPLQFMKEVRDVLDDEGVWCFEQSYLPSLLKQGAYDTICHEHLEYYALRQVQWLTDRAGLKILDVFTNDVNGGSFAVTVAKSSSSRGRPPSALGWYLESEVSMGLGGSEVYQAFRRRIDDEKTRLLALLDRIRGSGEKVVGYGASTKGNVVLQYCGIGPDRVSCIAEVNEDKFGCYTPGSGIPIVPEDEARSLRPDYFLVLPWHFRDSIVRREEEFLRAGGKLIFPLPAVEIVSA